MRHDVLDATRRFWNTNPCDGQKTFETRQALRYGKDPWLRDRLVEIARRQPHIVEIGCGQATDALVMCEAMAAGGSYTALDYSDESLVSARQACTERQDRLGVVPVFRQANAESLDMESDSVDYVYSFGVLHHSPDTRRTVHELYRVLKPGGEADIALYRTMAPKLLVAHALRGIQGAVDALSGSRHTLLALARRTQMEAVLGTAVLECFGVPVLRSYTEAGMRRLFSRFEITELTACGNNMPRASGGRHNPLGVFYWVHLRKPGGPR